MTVAASAAAPGLWLGQLQQDFNPARDGHYQS